METVKCLDEKSQNKVERDRANPPLDQYGDEYSAVLEDEQEITEYAVSTVANVSDGVNFEELNFLNHYRGCRAVLRLIDADQLTEGSEIDHKRFPGRERSYEKLNPDTQPPLLVEKGVVHDGNHRLRVGLRQGKTRFWCYDVKYDAERNSCEKYTKGELRGDW